MECYNFRKLWLCKLTQVTRCSGIMSLVEYPNVYLLVEQECDIDLVEEVPIFKSLVFGNLFWEGVNKCVFTPSDLDKVFVTEKIPIPDEVLTPEELSTGQITINRIKHLTRVLFHSNNLFDHA